MSNINTTQANTYDVPKEHWHTCKICGITVQKLAELNGGSGIYYKARFIKHLLEAHNIEPIYYFETICNIVRPNCACGICEQKVDISLTKSNFSWIKYKCGRYPGQQKWSNEAKESRKGSGNPMFNKQAWNKDLTKDNNSSMAITSEKLKGRKISNEVKLKQSESAKRRTIHGHTGILHSAESKEKMRRATLQQIKNGDFKQNKSKCFLEFGNILKELAIEFIEEQGVLYWSVDYYLPKYDLYIEVDGDYWHSNPKIYPNGPKTQSQKINAENDKRKNTYFENQKMKLVRFWESDILNNKDFVICELKKLLELNILENCQSIILK